MKTTPLENAMNQISIGYYPGDLIAYHIEAQEAKNAGRAEAFGEVLRILDEAIAAEKKRVCHNCANAEKELRVLYGLETCPMAYNVFNEQRELDPNGYCHKFELRESEVKP